MNELIYLFVILTVVGVVLLLLKKRLEEEAEKKVIHILSWAFIVIGGIGTIAMVIGYFTIATP